MHGTLRITFELELADNPPLYQELAQFPKGPRRASRLRTLAHAGLMAQITTHMASPSTLPSSMPSQDICMKQASLELFGPALEQ